MRSDADIKHDIERELQWDPMLADTEVTVTVRNGIAALQGYAHSYAQKAEAEVAAKRVAGVTALANDIQVRLPALDRRPDPEIIADAAAALGLQLPGFSDSAKVISTQGWITLEGEVETEAQRQLAERAVRSVQGVRGVINALAIKPRLKPAEIKHQIEEAFRRSAEIDAERVRVEARDGEVILTGAVRSWAERTEAEQAAWRAPGVRRIENRLRITP